MQTNPFKPTAGKTPPTIIGREDVLEEFNEGLINGSGAPGRLMRIAGVRGTGKTVLLDECSRLAQSRGWTVIKEVATEGLCQRILEQLQPKFQAKHARFEPTVAGISIGSIDIERIGPSLRDAMRQTISKNENGLLITLDEVQDAELDEVRTLSIAIQQVIGEDLDIAFVFAGLPSMIESIINGKTLTFLRRALPFDLKAVAVTEVSYSLEETIEASGMELQPGIAGQLAEATQGYPFMIQLVGYYAWQLARRAHTPIIGEEEAERGIATARERFLCHGDWARATAHSAHVHRLSAEHGIFGADELDQHGCRCPKQNASTGELRPQPPVKRIDYRGSFVRQGLICHPLHARLPLRTQSRTGS